MLMGRLLRANLMLMRYLMSLVLCCVACLGGESGTPTPAIPDPGCVLVDDEPLGPEPEPAFQPLFGEWSGECGGQALSIQVPDFDAGGTREIYEWMSFGDEEATPQECRDGLRVDFPLEMALGEDDDGFAGALSGLALHGRYVLRYDGVSGDVDREARAWTELFATREENAQVLMTMEALLSEDESTVSGSLYWYGGSDAPPSLIPDEGEGPSAPGSNPTPGSVSGEPRSVVAQCSFVLRRSE